MEKNKIIYLKRNIFESDRYNMTDHVVYDIETRAEGDTDTNIVYDFISLNSKLNPTQKIKVKLYANLDEICIRFTDPSLVMISFEFSL